VLLRDERVAEQELQRVVAGDRRGAGDLDQPAQRPEGGSRFAFTLPGV
jgi:hypothetical protein